MSSLVEKMGSSSSRASMLRNRLQSAGVTVASHGKLGNQDLNRLRQEVNQEIKNLNKDFFMYKDREEVREQVLQQVTGIVLEKGADFPKLMRPALMELAEEITNEMLGYGLIQPLLDDPKVTEVIVKGKHVWYEKEGQLYESELKYNDIEAVMHLIEKIIIPVGRRVDESTPMVDAALPDGSRVNIIIPPLAKDGPQVTIRRFKEQLTIDDLINNGTIAERDKEFLEQCVRMRLNIIVSGGTGSGKTTTLNVLSSFIPSNERIITIEDAAELQLQQEHVVRLESRPPNVEGKGEITIRDLVKNALRMRPDRIVVGEVRSGESLDMLQAMNTGHDGSLTTGHANSPRDMLSRLEIMVLMAGMELPIPAIREQIAAGINMIIHTARLPDGQRKVTHVTGITGTKDGKIQLQDLLIYDPEAGTLVPAPDRSNFTPVLQQRGIDIPDWLSEGR